MAGVVIVGTGPGIGTSVARRFGTVGMRVGLVDRQGGGARPDRVARQGVRAFGHPRRDGHGRRRGSAAGPFDPDRIAKHY